MEIKTNKKRIFLMLAVTVGILAVVSNVAFDMGGEYKVIGTVDGNEKLLEEKEFENVVDGNGDDERGFPPKGTKEIAVRHLGDDPSREQFDDLENLSLTDPFMVAVKAPDLAGEESRDFGVTAFYDKFDADGEPDDRLTEPPTPLDFDENGIATITIGSLGTDADVSTGVASGRLHDDATFVNNIEVPEGAESVAVEVE